MTDRRNAEELTRRLFHGLPRADQRRWAGAYMTGLLSTPGKKSVRNMGWSVCASYTASQSLHQVVNESTWSWTDVRRELTAWCHERTEVRGWALERVMMPKRGHYSAGVHRRFDATAGRTLGCQLGLGLFLLTGSGAAVPVDWRLYLPDEWLDDASLRRRARIPDTVRAGSPGGLMVDLAATTAGPGAPLVADAETVGEAAELIEGFDALGVDWAVSVPATTPVFAAPQPAARRPGQAPCGTVVSAGGLAGQMRDSARGLGAGPAVSGPAVSSAPAVSGPSVSGAPHSPGVLPVHVYAAHAVGPLRLVASWAPGKRAPERVWLTTLHGERLTGAAALFTRRVVGAEALEGLDDCGMRDFEGRSYPGWHRHMSLVSAAYAHRMLDASEARAASDARAADRVADRVPQRVGERVGGRGLGRGVRRTGVKAA
ncbi:transposase [Streptomyces sp. NPDC049837]|uniref:IS701 family transposase n=1 Tax=Streptomyces sp. NPDC049837 TaxID=3155277 RepID=UPI0034417C42